MLLKSAALSVILITSLHVNRSIILKICIHAEGEIGYAGQ